MKGQRRGVMVVALAALVVFAGLSVVFAFQLGDGPADYRGTALLGDPVPALTLPELDGDGRTGETVDLAGLSGRAVVINFFNSWCIPCKEEEPSLKEFFAAHRDERDFQMIGIVRDDTEPAVRRWVEERRIEWTVVLDPGARASVDFGTAGQPETFAVSPRGTIVAVHRGRATIDDLENMLAIARGRRVPE